MPKPIGLVGVSPGPFCFMPRKGCFVPDRGYLFGVGFLDSQHLVPKLVVLRNLGRLPVAARIVILKGCPNLFGRLPVLELKNIAIVFNALSHGAAFRSDTAPAAI